MAADRLNPAVDAFWESRMPVAFANPRDPAAVAAAESVMARGGQDPGTAETAHPDGLVHFFTSGSSGRPKIIGFTREALLVSARAVNQVLDVTADDVWLRALPDFHVGGFQVGARAWAAGAACVAREAPWEPRDFVRQCAAARVTLVSLVPTQVFDLVDAGVPAPGSLRAVLVGGGELRPALHHRALELGWPVRAGYGLTEAASTVALQEADEPDCTRLTVLPHWQARTDADGLLELCGPSLPRAIARWHAGAAEYAWQPFEPPLRTSDRVHLAGRSLVFVGRCDRVVKRLGELIDLAQLERALADAAIAAGAFGRVRLRAEPNPRTGHRLVLACLDAAEGRAVAARFDPGQPAYARLEEIRVVADLGVSPLGKPLA